MLQKCGWGRTVRPNNDEHVGEYKNGLMDGFGKCVSAAAATCFDAV